MRCACQGWAFSPIEFSLALALLTRPQNGRRTLKYDRRGSWPFWMQWLADPHKAQDNRSWCQHCGRYTYT